MSISFKKVHVAWRVTRDTNVVHVVILCFKMTHLDNSGMIWGPVISLLAGHRGISNGKVGLI